MINITIDFENQKVNIVGTRAHATLTFRFTEEGLIKLNGQVPYLGWNDERETSEMIEYELNEAYRSYVFQQAEKDILCHG